MEVTQVVGARTRARALALAATASASAAEAPAAPPSTARTKRRRNASPVAAALATVDGVGTTASYLQLRSRSVLMADPRARSATLVENSGSAGEEGISRCSSNSASREVVCQDSESSRSYPSCCCSSREKRETMPTSELRSAAGDLDSAVGVRSRRRMEEKTTSTMTMMPSETEIEEFFAVAEREERRRFTDKYNFDIINDVPLEGRYEWVRI